MEDKFKQLWLAEHADVFKPVAMMSWAFAFDRRSAWGPFVHHVVEAAKREEELAYKEQMMGKLIPADIASAIEKDRRMLIISQARQIGKRKLWNDVMAELRRRHYNKPITHPTIP